MNSFTITIVELITSMLGTGLASALFGINKLIYKKSKFLATFPIINISYFGSSSVIVTILIILKKLEQIEQLYFYKFSKIITFLYSYLSKFLAIFNLLTFIYLLSFIISVTFYLNSQEAEMLINEIASVEYKCLRDDTNCGVNKEHNSPIEEITFLDFIIICSSVFLSNILTYYNGASFYFENKRIAHLIKGKIKIELIPTESKSLCDKNFCEFLNSLICYKLTLLQILWYISLISVIYFIFSLIILIEQITHPWPQALLLGNSFFPFGLVLSVRSFIFSLYGKFIDCCGNSESPSKRKYIMIILLLLFILNFCIQIITFSSIIASQNGNSKVGILIDINANNYFEKLNNNWFKNYFLSHVNDNYLIFGIKIASLDKIFFPFIIGAALLVCNAILIILKINYFRRTLVDYITPLRNYIAKLFEVEENGQKTNLELINIIPIRKNINGKETSEIIQYYSRKIITQDVDIRISNTN